MFFFFFCFSFKVLIASSCNHLNLSKSNTLFAAFSMLSLLKMSYGSSSSASYGIVSRSSSFTKNVFFGFFKFFVVFFLKFFWLLLPCFFYSFLHFLCLSLMCYLRQLLYFLPEINLLEVHYNQLFLYLLSFTKYVFFIFSYFCIFEGLF